MDWLALIHWISQLLITNPIFVNLIIKKKEKFIIRKKKFKIKKKEKKFTILKKFMI